MVSRSTSTTNTKRVSWNESVRCYYVRGCNASTWYSDSDYNVFKQDALQTLDNAEQQRTLEEDCTRGLEHLVDPLVGRNKRQRRLVAWNVVYFTLAAQWRAEARQRQGPLDNTPLAIASTYSQKTILSQKEAHRRGLEDQLEVRSFDMEEEATIPIMASKWNPEPLKNLHSCKSMTPYPCRRSMDFMDIGPIPSHTVPPARSA